MALLEASKSFSKRVKKRRKAEKTLQEHVFYANMLCMNELSITTLEAKLLEINNRTMSESIADKTKTALANIRSAKRLLAKAEIALSESEAFYATRK